MSLRAASTVLCHALPQVVWSGYLKTMRALGFNSSIRLYAASGMLTYGASGGHTVTEWLCLLLCLCCTTGCMLTYGASGGHVSLINCYHASPSATDEMARVKNYLIRTGVCSEVHHKEQYIPQQELEGACYAATLILAKALCPFSICHKEECIPQQEVEGAQSAWGLQLLCPSCTFAPWSTQWVDVAAHPAQGAGGCPVSRSPVHLQAVCGAEQRPKGGAALLLAALFGASANLVQLLDSCLPFPRPHVRPQR